MIYVWITGNEKLNAKQIQKLDGFVMFKKISLSPFANNALVSNAFYLIPNFSLQSKCMYFTP